MNVLQILPDLDIGGVERGTVDLARYLTLNGHKSVVVSGGGRLLRRLDEIGARHYKLPMGRKSPFTILLMVNRLLDIIKKENIDIVHARSRVPAIIGFIAAKISNKVFITTAHGYYNMHLPSRAMSWGRFVIVASTEIARHMIEDFKTPRGRIRFIPRGVNLNEFRFMHKDKIAARHDARGRKNFVVGMISRITPLKGHTDLLRAVSIIARTTPGLKVLIAGDAPASKARYQEELQLLTRRLGISNIVKFMGAREDVPEVLSQLDVLVLPTKTPEAFGRVIIEAQAAGVPVVASRIGGIVDIIRDGVNGLLSFPEDPRSIANAILRLIKDDALARSLALAGRRGVEKNYSLEAMSEKTLQVYKEAMSLKRILVIKTSALGDVILSVPSLRAIRERFPSAVIKVLVGLFAGDALRGCPYIDERIVYDSKSRDSGFRGLMKIASQLRREDFDIVVDLQNNKTSHLLSFLSMSALRYGYDNKKWSFFLNRRVKDTNLPVDPIGHQFRALKLLGIEKAEKKLELWPSKQDREWVDKFLMENWIDSGHPLVGINIGASDRWQSKRWDPSNIAQLCGELAKRYGIRALLTGTGKDLEIAREIAMASGSKPVISAGKTDIMRLAALIKRCKTYITTDSAPMHIAACMGIPFVALFGPTDPKRHLPQAKAYKVLKGSIKCIACYKPVCKKDNECMKQIKVEDAMAAVEEFLSKGVKK